MKIIIIALFSIAYYKLLKKVWYGKPKTILTMRLDGFTAKQLKDLRGYLAWSSFDPRFESNVPGHALIDEKSRLEPEKAMCAINDYIYKGTMTPGVIEQLTVRG